MGRKSPVWDFFEALPKNRAKVMVGNAHRMIKHAADGCEIIEATWKELARYLQREANEKDNESGDKERTQNPIALKRRFFWCMPQCLRMKSNRMMILLLQLPKSELLN